MQAADQRGISITPRPFPCDPTITEHDYIAIDALSRQRAAAEYQQEQTLSRTFPAKLALAWEASLTEPTIQ